MREHDFFRELKQIRLDRRADGEVLFDELEHRWNVHDADPGLYVLTAEVTAPPGWMLVADGEKLGRTTMITKLGQAERSLAPRIVRYVEEGIKDLITTKIELRVAIYGNGPAMIPEDRLTAIAREMGVHHLELWKSATKRVRKHREAYAGVDLADALSAFAAGIVPGAPSAGDL